MNIEAFRQKYPQYDEIPDNVLSSKIYQKYYKDKMPPWKFVDEFMGLKEIPVADRGYFEEAVVPAAKETQSYLKIPVVLAGTMANMPIAGWLGLLGLSATGDVQKADRQIQEYQKAFFDYWTGTPEEIERANSVFKILEKIPEGLDSLAWDGEEVGTTTMEHMPEGLEDLARTTIRTGMDAALLAAPAFLGKARGARAPVKPPVTTEPPPLPKLLAPPAAATAEDVLLGMVEKIKAKDLPELPPFVPKTSKGQPITEQSPLPMLTKEQRAFEGLISRSGGTVEDIITSKDAIWQKQRLVDQQNRLEKGAPIAKPQGKLDRQAPSKDMSFFGAIKAAGGIAKDDPHFSKIDRGPGGGYPPGFFKKNGLYLEELGEPMAEYMGQKITSGQKWHEMITDELGQIKSGKTTKERAGNFRKIEEDLDQQALFEERRMMEDIYGEDFQNNPDFIRDFEAVYKEDVGGIIKEQVVKEVADETGTAASEVSSFFDEMINIVKKRNEDIPF